MPAGVAATSTVECGRACRNPSLRPRTWPRRRLAARRREPAHPRHGGRRLRAGDEKVTAPADIDDDALLCAARHRPEPVDRQSGLPDARRRRGTAARRRVHAPGAAGQLRRQDRARSSASIPTARDASSGLLRRVLTGRRSPLHWSRRSSSPTPSTTCTGRRFCRRSRTTLPPARAARWEPTTSG